MVSPSLVKVSISLLTGRSGRKFANWTPFVAAKANGPIFRTPRDAAWSLTSVCNKWRWLLKRPKVVAFCKKHEIPIKSLKMYNFRHTWACNCLNATVDIFGAATMLGTSVKMLQMRYFHMNMDKIQDRYLRFIAEQYGKAAEAGGKETSANGTRRSRSAT
jgi:integrase